MTDAPRRRALARERGRRHRALRKRGKAAYCVRAHERRRAEALIKSGMPHHGSGIISGASGAGFVKQGDPIAVREMSINAAALSPRKLRFDSPFSPASFSSPAGALARSGGGNAQKRERTPIPPRRRSGADLICAAKSPKCAQ